MSISGPSHEKQAFGFLMLLSLTHGVIDLGPASLVALLPFLEERHGLTYTMVGTIMLFSQLTSSVTQPFFGLVSDRSNKRWLLPASLLLSGLGLSVVGLMPTYAWMLLMVVIFSLGTASFHPEGAHAARHLSGSRRARAMSIFSVGGNLGFALGPLYAVFLWNLAPSGYGLLGAAILPILLAIWVLKVLPRWEQLEKDNAASQTTRTEDLPPNNWSATARVTLLVILRSMIHLGMMAYIPFYWRDVLGNDPKTGVMIQTVYMMAGVAGTLFGSPVADKIGGRKLLLISFGMLLPLQVVIPFLSGWAMILVLVCSGFLVVSTFAVTLVMTQEYMPRSMGLASGINLGLAFGMGGVGALLLGMIADRWDVQVALMSIAALVPFTILLTLSLPPALNAATKAVVTGLAAEGQSKS